MLSYQCSLKQFDLGGRVVESKRPAVALETLPASMDQINNAKILANKHHTANALHSSRHCTERQTMEYHYEYIDVEDPQRFLEDQSLLQ